MIHWLVAAALSFGIISYLFMPSYERYVGKVWLDKSRPMPTYEEYLKGKIICAFAVGIGILLIGLIWGM